MTNRTKIVYARMAVILAAVPVLTYAYEFGPPPGYTGAPGNQTCIVCHAGTVNSGPGNVKISLPSGNSGTYVPGQSMQILVQITDSTESGFGFQLTARMGSANTTQSGDMTTTDANTQVFCTDGSGKANGQTCPATAPNEYIEHNLTGFEASIQSSPKGSYTYSFNWTPPAAGSGTVTMYVAANCGPASPIEIPTHVYTSKLTLTEAAGGPALTNVLDAESARASITSGQWVAIYGSGLANTTRTWTNTDFTGGTSPGSPLPSMLDGVGVTIGGLAASVYLVSPTQLNVLSPSNLALGPAPVVVTNNGSVSGAFTTTIVEASPSFFYYPAGGNLYPAAVHLSNGNLVGDPAVQSGTEKAHPGETIEMFANGLAASQGGVIVSTTTFTSEITMTAAPTSGAASSLSVLGAALVFAGEFQVNVQLPANIEAGNYTLTLSVPNGSTSTSNVSVLLPVGP